MGNQIKHPTIDEMNQDLERMNNKLEILNAHLSAFNSIRSMIESGKTIDDIEEYVLSSIKVGRSSKENVLLVIKGLQLAIAEDYMKLVNKDRLI